MTPDLPSEPFGLGTVIRAAAASTYPKLGAALGELDSLVGLQPIKDQVAEIVNFKLEDPGYSMGHCNMRFVGPPGVGKTVVAKIVGRILSACGLVQLRGDTPAEIECVEMTKASIIGEAVGTTSPKAQAFLEQHVGRVILFDEALETALERGASLWPRLPR
jgi:AAA+ superfamily predicted ATPase